MGRPMNKFLAIFICFSSLSAALAEDKLAPAGSHVSSKRGFSPYGMGGGMGMNPYGMGGAMGMNPYGMGGAMGMNPYGMGGGQSSGQSRQAANEITKLGTEASKGMQENLKNFTSGQEKGLQSFFNSLKESQPKEDNSKLLESLSKASQGGGGDSASAMGAITDNIVKAIDDNSKTRIESIGMIGKAMIKPPPQPVAQQPSANANPLALNGGSRGPLNQLMGLSGKPEGADGSTSSNTGLPSLGSHPTRGVRPYNSPE